MTLSQDGGPSNSYRATPRHNADGRLTIRRRPSWTDFVFRFVAGFEYSGFVYFVTVQREFPASPHSSLVTRLVRLCPHDVGFQSYTELTLHCRSPTANTNSGPATASQLATKVRLVTCRSLTTIYTNAYCKTNVLVGYLTRVTSCSSCKSESSLQARSVLL